MIGSVPHRRFGLVLAIVAAAVALCGLQAAFARASLVAAIPSSSISGQVTDKVTGDPVAGVDVGVLSPGGSVISGSFTDSSGYYDVEGLAAGTYRIRFQDNSGYYAFQYYKGKTTLGASTAVTVRAAAELAGINAALVDAAHVTGKVTDRVTGDPIAGVSVGALWPSGDRICGAFSDSSGYYDLGGLAAGSYRVVFDDNSGYYARQYFNQKPRFAFANAVTVAAGAQVTAVDAAMVELEADPPMTVDDAPAEWRTSGVSVTLTASDAGSGVFATFYKINGGTTRTYSSPIRVSAQGRTTIEYWSIDRAGNAEDRRTAAVTVFSRPSGRGAPSQPSTPPSVTHGVAFTTLGCVVRHAAGTYPVTLQFYRNQSGHWVLRKSVTAKVDDFLTFSKYWRTTSVAYSGKWRVRARHKVGHTNLYSDYRYFTAK